MASVKAETRACASCGAPLDSSLSGDESTCMVCLLRIGLQTTAEEADAAVPDRIGPYRIARREDGQPDELGHGAMGVTFRATDESLQRPVALKIINTKLASRSAEARERFTREARAAAALRHPNIATAYQFGVREDTGQFFYAMELVEGETLEERVRRLGPLDVLTTIDIALQVSAALAAAEERGLVHRDLKPGNLMLVSGDNGESTIKVIDFGVAKAISEKTNAMALTHGGFVGTPAFASPEQFTSAPVDVRSDIYSLGATLWFLLTGHMLFSGRTVEEIREARRSKPLPIEQLKAARLPRRFISLLMSMLATEPAARPAGARELAAKLQGIRRSITGRGKTAARLALAATLVALVTVVAVRIFHSPPPQTTVPVIPEKSIAVLPFENFTDDKENAYFADGVQDDVLTDLTKVADLKVISRRSVAQYRDTKQSIREIGKALQVAHVLGGSVRKVAGRIHVTAQLIDTRNERQTWAENYDRDIADLFQIQSEISQAIVLQLKATLSPAARAAIEEKPTQDKEAYDLYLRARALVVGQIGVTASAMEDNAVKAVMLLESAIARDPNFTLAYCVLGDTQLILDDIGDKGRLAKAKEAIDAAFRSSPNSAEAHLTLARYLVRGGDTTNTSAAEKELSIAAAGLPGRVDVFNLRAELEEKQGKWKQALLHREKAAELDPRDGGTAEDLANLYVVLRRYENAERVLNHMTATTPQQSTAMFWRQKSSIALAKGDAKGAMAALDSSPSRNLGIWGTNHMIANLFVMEREYPKAEEILQSIEETAKSHNAIPRALADYEPFRRGISLEKLGRIARFRGEKEKARGYFEAARARFEEWLAKGQKQNLANPGMLESHVLAYIAEIDAGLGRKEDAIREGRNAVETYPLSRNPMDAADIATFLAIVYMWTGERDAALQGLAEVAKLSAWPAPWGPTPTAGDLKLNPLWDELRNDPRFDKIIAEAAKPIKLD